MKLHHFHYCIILVYPIEIDNQHPSLLLSINQADLRRNQHTDGKVLIRRRINNDNNATTVTGTTIIERTGTNGSVSP